MTVADDLQAAADAATDIDVEAAAKYMKAAVEAHRACQLADTSKPDTWNDVAAAATVAADTWQTWRNAADAANAAQAAADTAIEEQP